MADDALNLLSGIDPTSNVLELGPSINPKAPRSRGWNVTVVDHATQDELIEKYRNDTRVDVSNIEKVDYVWRGGPLHDAVPPERHGTFDALIASHVIEHIPDPIGFLQSAERLLHPRRGVLALAVPDKRWCFDYFKQLSTTGQMLDANRRRAQRHSPSTRFDASAYVAFDGNRTSWGREPLQNLFLPDTLDHAFSEFNAWSDNPDAPYVDCHAWHFTPASFRLLILELGALGYCDWHISWLAPQPAVEFITPLKPGAETFISPQERDERRLALLKQILIEVREQVELAPPAVAPAAVQPEVLSKLLDELAELRRQNDDTAALLRSALDRLEEAAGTDAMVRATLRPLRAVWRGALPLRRQIARMRGRI